MWKDFFQLVRILRTIYGPSREGGTFRKKIGLVSLHPVKTFLPVKQITTTVVYNILLGSLVFVPGLTFSEFKNWIYTMDVIIIASSPIFYGSLFYETPSCHDIKLFGSRFQVDLDLDRHIETRSIKTRNLESKE